MSSAKTNSGDNKIYKSLLSIFQFKKGVKWDQKR